VTRIVVIRRLDGFLIDGVHDQRFSVGEKSLAAYRPGSQEAIGLPVELDQILLDKASG
jgi:hypothetical protein